MEKVFGQNDPKICRYAEELCAPEDSVLREVRLRSTEKGLPDIQVGVMDGLHLEVLTKAFGAEKAVEIGTLGGYSGICICRGLKKGGILYSFEVSPKHAEVARESFLKAGFAKQTEVIVGQATETLPTINGKGPFDLVFIDADKQNYPNYLNWAAENLRIGGVVLADNTFAWGTIADTQHDNPQHGAQVKALREFNSKAVTSGRFRATILPTGEGLTMAVKIK